MELSKIAQERLYFSKDYEDFKKEITRIFSSNFYQNFSELDETSPIMNFVDVVSYLSDALSFKINYAFYESLLQFAMDRKNVMELAYQSGYKAKRRTSAIVPLDFFQLVPARPVSLTQNVFVPDLNYALILKNVRVVSSEFGKSFSCFEDVDFNEYDEATVFETDQNGQPLFFLLRKRVKGIQGIIKEYTQDFGIPLPYSKIILPEQGISNIISVIDSEGNEWKEVDFIAQDLVYEEKFDVASGTIKIVPVETQRRFEARLNSDGFLEIHFGDGEFDGISLVYEGDRLIGKRYGLVPKNVSLKFRYLVSDGSSGNIPSQTIDSIEELDILNNQGLNPDTLDFVKSSVGVINPEAAIGGADEENTERIRRNGLNGFSSQNRCVTKKDYEYAALSIPEKYARVEECYVTSINDLDSISLNRLGVINKSLDNNDNVVLIYPLSKNANGHWEYLNSAAKENLLIYLETKKMLTDHIVIRDPYIINFGIRVTFSKMENAYSLEILERLRQRIFDYFTVKKPLRINQPIFYDDLFLEVKKESGVKNLMELKLFCKSKQEWGNDYSNVIYDFDAATKNNILYPPVDPSIFELKFITDVELKIAKG